MRLAEAQAPKFGHVLLEDMVAQIDLVNARRLVAVLDVNPSLDGRLDRHTGELLKHALEARFGSALRGSASASATRPASLSKQTEAKRMGPLAQMWLFVEAILRTIFATFIKPLLWSFGIAAILCLPLLLVFEPGVFARALGEQSPTPFLAGSALKWSVTAAAIGAAVMALRGLSTFLLSSRTFLSRNLGRHLPKDEALLKLIPVKTLRFYHNVLRCAGAVAFLSEFVLQMFVIALVTWSVSLHFPALFDRPDASFLDVQLYWLNQVFKMVDGPNTFGLSLSSLEANREVWSFGVAILSFKFLVIGMIVRLFLDSLSLQPRDISPAWGAALDRGGAPA